MTTLPTLEDIDLNGKRVLMRVDFNVPISADGIDDDTRIRACLPGIQQILQGAERLIIMSHLGRPDEGKFAEPFSLQPVAAHLATLLDRPVRLCRNWREDLDKTQDAVVMLENIRFEKGEKTDADTLARELADLCDVYVNDAFASTHRAHASTHGVAKYAPAVCAGPLLIAELAALSKALLQPARPMLAIVAGAKVSTKLTLLENLLHKVDKLIVGGGIANTFLLAAGYQIGHSLVETELVETAGKLLQQAKEQGKEIPLPVDVVCGKKFDAGTEAVIRRLAEIEHDDLIMDVGPETAAMYGEIVNAAATIVWNGPPGVFEFEQFATGTRALANAIAAANGFSIAGGGDTLSAIVKFGVREQISCISTGGGAFLELLEGKTLPAVEILHNRRS
ncbi:MAG: phosphoglycerate kinase [Gammaproteobacteria bacterium]